MAERALAHIEKIEWIKPIEGADNIELIGVLGWVCIAKIGEFHVGDKCIYIEIDSLVNKDDERFKFLESKNYKIKTMKLGKFKVISQGLALPITEFPEVANCNIGDDVTEKLKVTYYNPDDVQRKKNPIKDKNAKYNSMIARHKKLFSHWPYNKLIRKDWGRKFLFVFFGKKKDAPKGFPEWIKKTDETRVENMPWILDQDRVWIQTEKLDGTSCTYAVDTIKHGRYEFIVCSRNVRQQGEDDVNFNTQASGTNVYWEMAHKYDIQKKLENLVSSGYKRVVLQGECVGEAIQGNPYKMSDRDFYVFNLIIDGNRLPSVEAAQWCKTNGLKHVPIISDCHELPKTMEEMKLEADGLSVINPKVKREGFVYRSQDGLQSFKNVSREYLLKHS